MVRSFLSLNLRVCVIVAIALAPAGAAFGAADSVVTQSGLAVAMAPVTLRDLPPHSLRAPGHHEQRRQNEDRSTTATLSTAPALHAATIPTIPAPPVSVGFRSTFDMHINYPSDANGAVGPKHVLSVSNTGYMVSDRTGKILWQDFNYGFWGDPTAQGGEEYDARAAYDPIADRWVIVSLFDRGSLGESTLLIAVTATGDPTGAWNRFRIPIASDTQTLGDFTRLALTRDAIVITANVNGPNVFEADAFIVQKSDAYVVFPQTLPFGRVQLAGLSDLVPVAVHGSDDPSIRLLSPFSNVLVVYTIQNGSPAVVASLNTGSEFDNFSGSSVVGPQAGGPLMDVGYPTFHYAVQRNGVIWIVESVFESSPPRSSIAWWRVHLPLSSSSVLEKGLVDDPSGKMFFGFPSIDVNAAGGALIGYSTFTAQQFPSAGYSYINPAGNLSQPASLKAGEVAYVIDRWADYSMTVVDPVNDIDFWTAQTYTMPPPSGPLAPRWSMWWGKITPSNTPPRHRAATH